MRTTEFFQGRTVRWGLAWSFTSEGMVGDKVGGLETPVATSGSINASNY